MWRSVRPAWGSGTSMCNRLGLFDDGHSAYPPPIFIYLFIYLFFPTPRQKIAQQQQDARRTEREHEDIIGRWKAQLEAKVEELEGLNTELLREPQVELIRLRVMEVHE